MIYPKENINPKKKYYALTWAVDPEGQLIIEGQTVWVGFADIDRRVELRKFSEVLPEYIADHWISCQLPFCVVNTREEYVRWYFTGGNALITIEMTKRFLPNVMNASPCVKIGSLGFTDVKNLPKVYSQSAPTPKMRMRVLKRDKRRCSICGRSPDNNTDIELNVHHIRPFGQGGVTLEDNLITLCSTCHKGLDPHYDWSLHELVENPSGTDIITRIRKQYFEDVQRYRDHVKMIWKKMNEQNKCLQPTRQKRNVRR